ncbi:hypothetical protein [Bartonella sp. B30(2025)]
MNTEEIGIVRGFGTIVRMSGSIITVKEVAYFQHNFEGDIFLDIIGY